MVIKQASGQPMCQTNIWSVKRQRNNPGGRKKMWSVKRQGRIEGRSGYRFRQMASSEAHRSCI